MGFLCAIAGHRWNGCKCERCGAVRDEGHDWNGCICRVCGRRRGEGHDWDGCTCRRCGYQKPHEFDETGICKICGAGQTTQYYRRKLKTEVRMEPCERCGKPTPHLAVICSNPADPNHNRVYRSDCISCGYVPFCKSCNRYVSVTSTRNEFDGAESVVCDHCGRLMNG